MPARRNHVPDLCVSKFHRLGHDSRSTELWEVHGATHVNCLGTDPEAYRDRVLQWFEAH
jgi:hypothetical protein